MVAKNGPVALGSRAGLQLRATGWWIDNHTAYAIGTFIVHFI